MNLNLHNKMFLLQVGLITSAYISGMILSKKLLDLSEEDYTYYALIYTGCAALLLMINSLISDNKNELHQSWFRINRI
mgnify:FL=1